MLGFRRKRTNLHEKYDHPSWREMRDAAAVALHLGGGLSPREVRDLKVEDVIPAAGAHRVSRVVVRAHGQTPRREVPLALWASRVLAQWLAVREAQKFDGSWLLPSTGRGSQWKKGAHNLAVADVLRLAGFPEDTQMGGCFRLRHTYALRQLAHGTPLTDLGALLGLRDEEALQRYRAVVPARVKVY